MKLVREQYKLSPSVLQIPGYAGMVVPDPRMRFADDDPVVLAHPRYFIDEGVPDDPRPTSIRIDQGVEQATAAPGEKRRGPIRAPRAE